VLDWAGDVSTVGEALDRLQEMAPSERRLLLDHARQECGLPSIEDVERAERARAPLALPPPPLEPSTQLVRTEGGGYAEVPLVEPRMVRTPSGGIADANDLEADAARQRTLEESLQRQRRARDEERAPEAAAHTEYQRARREQLERETPAGIPIP